MAEDLRHLQYQSLLNKRARIENIIERNEKLLITVKAEIDKRQSTTLTEEDARIELGKSTDYIRG